MLDDQLRTLLDRLDLPAKVRLLTGADFWSTWPEPTIGLRRIVVSDGPSGVRGETHDERDPSLSLPSATALGASWDVDLARRYGGVLADEARRQGVDVVLGPTINLHRSPLGGRHFEAFSEDPLLTAELAAAYVAGVQERGIGATVKHYVANDAETDRFTVDNVIAERPLRELYLAAFEQAVVESRAWLVMSAYNAVNGPTMTENPLLRTPLSTEWGFDGVVVSDWTAVRSTEASANAAQDLVMPGPKGTWGDALVAAVEAGRVPMAAVDEKVLRLLRLAARVGALDGIPAAVTDPPAPLDGVALARETAAAGSVLVSNVSQELPWDAASLRSVAVIGHNADVARIQGGGSAEVLPERVTSPLEGLRAALGPQVDVRYVMGAKVCAGVLPLPRTRIVNPVTGGPGARLRFLDATGTELAAEDRLACDMRWVSNGIPECTHTIELSTRYRPESSGTMRFGGNGIGPLRLTVDGVEVINTLLVEDRDARGGTFFNRPYAAVDVEVQAEREVELTVALDPPMDGPFPYAAITLGAEVAVEDEDAEIARAAAVAADSDVAVVVVGTNALIESEGFDRASLALPGRQDDLVRAVAAANPRTVVVVNSGSPVIMPWRDDVAAVLLTWFGGQEYGHAVADMLLGLREPGGRLPTTWPAEESDVPVLATTPVDGVLRYDEGIHVGYRAWLRHGREPAYPFGHGLGYTTWQLRSVTNPPSVTVGEPVPVTVTVANTGRRAGRHVVQVYLRRRDRIERPARWLAGFAKVEVAPGDECEVTVAIGARAFQHYDGGWRTEPGEYEILVGNCVSDTPLSSTVAIG